MRKAFTRANYIVWALVFAAITYAIIAWIPLIGFVGELAGQTASFSETVPIILQLLWGGLFDLSASDTGYGLLLALLTGLNFSMLLYYARRARVRSNTAASAGALGFFVGVLGFGCAACGSLFANTLLAAIAGAGLADRVPETGFPFQVVGVGLILYSIWRLNRAINDPLVCTS